MNFDQVIANTRQQKRLFSALLELTYRCNLDCFFCYNDTNLEGTPLSLAQYLNLLDDLQRMGCFNIILSGGEPLAHPDFFALGSAARERGFVVRIKSNGHALREAMARRIKEEIDPFMIEVSLHGAGADSHDRQTRVPGSFEQLLSNLEVLNSLELRFQLNAVLTRWNQADIEGMYAIADQLGVNLQFDTQLSPRDDGDRGPLELAPDTEAHARLVALQRKRQQNLPSREREALERGLNTPEREETTPHCGAGFSTITVDPYGTVYPCVQWRRPIGSLHQASIGEIWSSGLLDQIRHANLAAAGKTRMLEKRGSSLGYCPGLADALSGSATTVYPTALLQQQLWKSGEK